jgi:hypothetical protein
MELKGGRRMKKILFIVTAFLLTFGLVNTNAVSAATGGPSYAIAPPPDGGDCDYYGVVYDGQITSIKATGVQRWGLSSVWVGFTNVPVPGKWDEYDYTIKVYQKDKWKCMEGGYYKTKYGSRYYYDTYHSYGPAGVFSVWEWAYTNKSTPW